MFLADKFCQPILYAPILRKLIPGSGRIPIAVILGSDPASGIVQEVATRLAAAGLSVGRVDTSGVRVGAAQVVDGDVGAYSGGQVLMRDQTVDAVLVCIQDPRVLYTGLPFDRYDVLVLAGTTMALPEASSSTPASVLHDVRRSLLPACQGSVMELSDPLQTKLGADAVAAALLAADVRHRAWAAAQAV